MTDRTELAERIVASIFFNDPNYRPRKRDVPLSQDWDKAVECAAAVLGESTIIAKETK